MKKNKEKHHESTIGKIIYGFMLFAPLFAILSTILVNIWNTQNTDVSNIFYYAVEQTELSNLFNWAKNSTIYTGIQATADILNITNTFIPMLLTYWLIMSVFYFLYDIILIMLNIIHKKIHEVQDSI